ncbi:hypothetical protein [Brachybacterium sp. FME24]|uniref:hypothetical protein n=1 Tax=Brachybacterium sp. FME24 TaxID=2742605 RepID=UPI001868B081|nr:hypothetical protein [Brachybacterium sp. FME24]
MTDSRLDLARLLIESLASACPGSTVELRGSLAAGTADEFSDIDLRWTVPEHLFGQARGSAPSAIASITPLLSFRSDPDWQTSPSRRLLFARLAGVPVWWRLDLEVRTAVSDDADSTPAPSQDDVEWDPYESALQNALATVKAVGRGQEEQADDLLVRAYERIALDPLGTSRTDRIIELAEIIAGARPHLRGFADDVIAEASARF